jgi:hypothetical protein
LWKQKPLVAIGATQALEYHFHAECGATLLNAAGK